MSQITSADLEQIRELSIEFSRSMQGLEQKGARIAHRTNLMIRFVSLLAVIAMLYVAYLTLLLGGDVRGLAANMVQMYQHFGVMTKDVTQMTASVESMSRNVTGIPTIAGAMQKMGADVSLMRADVASMSGDVNIMDSEMGGFTRNVDIMNTRFITMTQSVDFMRYNVNEMSQPVRGMGPMMMR